ncbi:hypothetical protein ESCOMMO153M_22600 [Escherichia coli]
MQACREAPLDLGEVLSVATAHTTDCRIDIGLRSHDNPGAATADYPKVFGNSLQLQHHLRIFANELTDFIHHKEDVLTIVIQPLFYPLAKIIDIQREVFIELFHPLAGGFKTLLCGLA